ncbi:heparinase II/III family protein [Gemmatimonadota bacterium]
MKILTAVAVLILSSFAQLLAYEVFESHPRLFFREVPWGERSIVLTELKERAKDPRFADFLDDLEHRSAANLAFKAVLLDDSDAARRCIDKLLAREDFGNTTDAGLELAWDAMAFDWLYNKEEFSEADKAKVIAKLEQGAQNCIDMYTSQGAHIFHTRMYAYPQGAAIAGLALNGHSEQADRFIEWGYRKYMDDLFPAQALQDGTVHSSMAYGRKYIMWQVGQFIAAWYSATGENLWQLIREQQDDWAWKEALFVIYGEQPDGRMIRFGDNFYRGTERFSFRVVSERAHYYDESVGYEYMNYLLKTHADTSHNRLGMEYGNEYHLFLYWDPDHPTTSVSSLPKHMMFSPHGTGMVFWRSGWQSDDTYIFFKCGDYFDNHGHFDAGHVEVFRRAPLLIEGGSYRGGTSSDHYKKFFHQSVSHNTVQVADPSDPEDDGSHRYYNNQNQGDIAEYLANEDNEYGDLVDYHDQDRFAYLAADISSSFPDGRVMRAIRELAWIADRWLIVVDDIRLRRAGYQPRILWHYTVEPSIEGKSMKVADGGGVAALEILAPADAVIERVDGFRVGTGDYPPRNPDPSLGIGRAEVKVPQAERDHYTFVQVIEITDEGLEGRQRAELVNSDYNDIRIRLPEGVLILEGTAGVRSRVSLD